MINTADARKHSLTSYMYLPFTFPKVCVGRFCRHWRLQYFNQRLEQKKSLRQSWKQLNAAQIYALLWPVHVSTWAHLTSLAELSYKSYGLERIKQCKVCLKPTSEWRSRCLRPPFVSSLLPEPIISKNNLEFLYSKPTALYAQSIWRSKTCLLSNNNGHRVDKILGNTVFTLTTQYEGVRQRCNAGLPGRESTSVKVIKSFGDRSKALGKVELIQIPVAHPQMGIIWNEQLSLQHLYEILEWWNVCQRRTDRPCSPCVI